MTWTLLPKANSRRRETGVSAFQEKPGELKVIFDPEVR